MLLPPPGVCAFCPTTGTGRTQRGTPPAPATTTYTDALGFAYALCGAHHDALVGGLRRITEHRLAERVAAVARRPYQPRPSKQARRTAPRLRGKSVTGEDQRRARGLREWSLGRLATEVGRSRSQLQGAEVGRRPVDPVVAAWVVAVLTDVTAPDILPTKEQEGAVARR